MHSDMHSQCGTLYYNGFKREVLIARGILSGIILHGVAKHRDGKRSFFLLLSKTTVFICNALNEAFFSVTMLFPFFPPTVKSYLETPRVFRYYRQDIVGLTGRGTKERTLHCPDASERKCILHGEIIVAFFMFLSKRSNPI